MKRTRERNELLRVAPRRIRGLLLRTPSLETTPIAEAAIREITLLLTINGAAVPKDRVRGQPQPGYRDVQRLHSGLARDAAPGGR